MKDESVNKLIRAADLWWRGKRPLEFGKTYHIQNPTVNCATDREKRLARAVARWHINKLNPSEKEMEK